ncbi:MAG: M23 family metallopeptidase [Desulfovibrionaceae bacterium]
MKKIFFTFGIIVLVAWGFESTLYTQDIIENDSPNIVVPENIEDAVPFFVEITTKKPSAIVISWTKKKYVVTQEKFKDKYHSVTMLALPIDTPSGEQKLVITINKKKYEYIIKSEKRTYDTQKLSVEGQYVQPPKAVQERLVKERDKRSILFARVSDKRLWDKDTWVRPAEGILTSSFGARRIFNGEHRNPHQALDFRGSTGAPIYAAHDGVVAFAGAHYFTGNIVYIDHGQGIISGYAHMSKILVKKNERVKAGQKIGEIGATGRVTGPHLHFTLYSYGRPVDSTNLVIK